MSSIIFASNSNSYHHWNTDLNDQTSSGHFRGYNMQHPDFRHMLTNLKHSTLRALTYKLRLEKTGGPLMSRRLLGHDYLMFQFSSVVTFEVEAGVY